MGFPAATHVAPSRFHDNPCCVLPTYRSNFGRADDFLLTDSEGFCFLSDVGNRNANLTPAYLWTSPGDFALHAAFASGN